MRRNMRCLVLSAAVVLSSVAAVSPDAVAASTHTAPVVTALNPARGSTVGYSHVIIDGRRFTGATSVTFGGKPAADVRVLDANRIAAYAPPKYHGTDAVVVHTKHGTSTATSRSRYTYVHAPTPGRWSTAKDSLPTGAASGDEVSMYDISCASAVHCVSVGTSGDRAAIQTRDGDRTSIAFASLPAGVSPSAASELDAVSCPTVDFCAAIGVYTDAQLDRQTLLLTMTMGSWTATTGGAPAAVAGSYGGPDVADEPYLSCGAAGSCLAGTGADDDKSGSEAILYRLTGGTWTPSVAPTPAGGQAISVTGVSCASGSYCVASEDSYPRTVIAVDDGSSWQAVAVAPAKGRPSVKYEPDVLGLACPSVGHCTMVLQPHYLSGVDAAPAFVSYAGSSFTYSALPVPADHARDSTTYGDDGEGSPHRLSCPAVTTCAWIDSYFGPPLGTPSYGSTSVVARLSGTAVQVSVMPETAPPGSVPTILRAIDCVSATSCVAVGGRGRHAHNVGVYDTFVNGVWTPGALTQNYVSASDAQYSQNQISCTAPGACAANAEVEYDFATDDNDDYGPSGFLGVSAIETAR